MWLQFDFYISWVPSPNCVVEIGSFRWRDGKGTKIWHFASILVAGEISHIDYCLVYIRSQVKNWVNEND